MLRLKSKAKGPRRVLMAEDFVVPSDSPKDERYKLVLRQIQSLMSDEGNLIANLANIAAMLTTVFRFHWVGFYLRDGDELVVGPFQGGVACTRIRIRPEPRGVCGAAAAAKETINVPDVDEFPGHIACSSLTRSEIVVPLVVRDETKLVLDVDSTHLAAFDETDRQGLEAIVALVYARHFL
jgi:L-methionine (R)-S-oxide reductase